MAKLILTGVDVLLASSLYLVIGWIVREQRNQKNDCPDPSYFQLLLKSRALQAVSLMTVGAVWLLISILSWVVSEIYIGKAGTMFLFLHIIVVPIQIPMLIAGSSVHPLKWYMTEARGIFYLEMWILEAVLLLSYAIIASL